MFILRFSGRETAPRSGLPDLPAPVKLYLEGYLSDNVHVVFDGRLNDDAFAGFDDAGLLGRCRDYEFKCARADDDFPPDRLLGLVCALQFVRDRAFIEDRGFAVLRDVWGKLAQHDASFPLDVGSGPESQLSLVLGHNNIVCIGAPKLV